MKNKILSIFLLIFAIQLPAKEHTSHEIIKDSYTFKGPGKIKTLIVKNYWGGIKVTGHNKKTVDVMIEKKIWARSQEQFDKAKAEMKLNVLQEEDLIEFYVDGPFHGDQTRRDPWKNRRYKVYYQFEIKVPVETALDLETINDGDIRIKDIQGKCTASNINGGIEAIGIREIGKIYALNEDVLIEFDRNPTQDCTVGSLNGDVDLYFKKNLSADFKIKTFNGEVYSDFETKRIKGEAYKDIKKNSKTVFKAGHHDKIRIGKGGPLIYWKGFNGDLLIRNQSKSRHASL